MNRKDVALGVLVAALVAGVSAPMADAAPAHTTIAVDPASATSAPIRYGYDIKEGGKAANFTADLANSYFGSGPFSVLRIPIYAGDGAGDDGEPDSADPADINSSLYAPIVTAARSAIAASHGQVLIDANLKDPSTGSKFAGWIRGSNFPDNYAHLLFNVVAYMQSQGVNIDAVGILNETSATQLSAYDGGLGYADAYGETVRDLKALIAGNGNPYIASQPPVTPVSTFTAPDSFAPQNDLVAKLDNAGMGDTADVESTHFYSMDRSTQSAELPNFVSWAGNRALWQTEFHWSQGAGAEHGYPEARDALLSAFTNFDFGLENFTWWNYGDDTSADSDYPIQGAIQQELVTGTTGLRDLAPPAETGTSNELMSGGLVARAFAGTQSGSNVVQLWIVDDTKSAQTHLTITGASAKAAKGVYWVAHNGGALSSSPATLDVTVDASNNVVVGTLPPHSIASVTITA